MIDEKVLIERLEEYKYSHLIEHDSEECLHCQENEDDWCSCRNCHVCLMDKVKEIVKDLASEHNNGWISVEECIGCKHKECKHNGKV